MVKRKKILIVEDEFLVYMGMRDLFERRGYEVCDVVTTGEEAIANAEKENPDVILMDLSLNGKMNGIEAGKQIKSRFGIPIVYMTGYSDKELIEKAKQTEPLGCYIKPVDIKDLLLLLDKNIRKH